MKNLKTLTMLLALIIISGNFQVKAQRNQTNDNYGPGWQCANIPDLTEEQQKKIDDLRVTHQKAMLQYRNEMQEKHAKLNTLRTADKADMVAINKTIDEMGDLHTKMMKEKESHRQQVRALLTEKQRVYYDSRPGRGYGDGAHCGRGRGMGKGRNMRNCPRW